MSQSLLCAAAAASAAVSGCEAAARARSPVTAAWHCCLVCLGLPAGLPPPTGNTKKSLFELSANQLATWLWQWLSQLWWLKRSGAAVDLDTAQPAAVRLYQTMKLHTMDIYC